MLFVAQESWCLCVAQDTVRAVISAGGQPLVCVGENERGTLPEGPALSPAHGDVSSGNCRSKRRVSGDSAGRSCESGGTRDGAKGESKSWNT